MQKRKTSRDSANASVPVPDSADGRGTSARAIRLTALAALVLLPLVAVGTLLADWWLVIPEATPRTFVGRQSCVKCHQGELAAWSGSHHDLAMKLATPETVLGDFSGVTLSHYGLTSRMYRDGDKYMIHTEGPDGKMHDYHVKWVFGVDPLQQYMVELHRPADAKPNELGQVQVLPISWDTQRQEWFYSDPPDVHAQLHPKDPLHWTNSGANWNYMCADCHSTDLRKNFNDQTCEYHTTFSEIEVSCEACHGPGSTHVQLAEANSLFWDRKQGYGLANLKSKDSHVQIETCARCHMRRARVVAPDFEAGDRLLDYFAHDFIRPGLYHADGQIQDEVYEYGSFIQSKMYHQGIRCTDCHEPHTAKLKHEGNKLCTSCHTHPAGKYDTPAHHHHLPNSTGAKCVECHMPHSTYMEVDARRDHSLRVPRPDLSVKLGTPNACTGCHLDASKLSPAARKELARSNTRNSELDYGSWLRAIDEQNIDKAPDPAVRLEIRAELARLNTWARDYTRKWFGEATEKKPHYAYAFHAAWNNLPSAEGLLCEVVRDKRYPAMARASALYALRSFETDQVLKTVRTALQDDDAFVRFAAVGYFAEPLNTLATGLRETDSQIAQLDSILMQLGAHAPQQSAALQNQRAQLEMQRNATSDAMGQLAREATPLLTDESRLVRSETGSVLAAVPGTVFTGEVRQARQKAIEEYIVSMNTASDRAMPHVFLGQLYEQLGDLAKAEAEYRTAIRVEEHVTGPRWQLAALLERRGETASDPTTAQQLSLEIRELRREEANRLGFEVSLLPQSAELQFRYARALYVSGEEDQALAAFKKAHELAPDSLDILFQLALLQKKRHEWEDAIASLEKLVKAQPSNAMFKHVLAETKQEAGK